MSELKLIISPKTKVGDLLDAFPQLEDVLLELSPSFAKLKNPILRKTVARVASLQQAAIVGGLKVDEMVNRLRKEVGQDSISGEVENNQYLVASPPDWFDETQVIHQLDASPIINSGGSPMADILVLAKELQQGEILGVKTPFVPAPIIDMLKDKGFKSFSLQKDGEVASYFAK
ncbi:MAG TPA: DUF1858 domain-containing protein [Prolixibacteraceae bacterium]|nr:DUF1858 domain-containing protein [Prolixibacteraceae bacterium]